MMKIILTIATLLLSTLSFAQTQTKILQIDIRGRSCSGGLGLCSNGESEYKNFTVIKQQQNE